MLSWAETNQVYSPAVDTFPSPSPSSPTDTDPSNLPPVPEISLSPISDDNESKKVSAYLDATDDGPSVADILRELRELPDSPLPDTKPPMTPYDDLSEVARPRSPLPILLQRHSSRPLAQTITTASPRRQGSGIRHSFSSVASPARPDSQVEATVELHEESASAFQDFLFWAYPQSVSLSMSAHPGPIGSDLQPRVQSHLDECGERAYLS